MKKLILSVIVSLFVSVTFATEKTPDPTGNFNETSKELSELLNSSSNFGGLNEEVLVKVKITLNEKHEIVVLNTSATDEELSFYIKNTLNYKKIASDELEIGKNFIFKIKFKV